MKHAKNKQDVAVVRMEASLREAASQLAANGIGCLVVVDGEGRVAGIVTDRDLALRAVGWNRDPDAVRVASVMTRHPRTLPLGAPREEQLALMRRMGVRRIPIVDGNGRPVALVASDDWLMWIGDRMRDLAVTADPSLRHGPHRGAAEILDSLEQHLNRHMAEERQRPMEVRRAIDRAALLGAIEQLREELVG